MYNSVEIIFAEVPKELQKYKQKGDIECEDKNGDRCIIQQFPFLMEQ